MVFDSRIREFESDLKKIFDNIDDYLENNYGSKYRLHPNRPGRGDTSNKASDGLFNVGAAFTAGFGSKYGRGYVVEVDLVTLEWVAADVQRRIESEVEDLLRDMLAERFPDRDIRVDRDGPAIKIYGELIGGVQ